MKAFLMFRDRDFELQKAPPPNEDDLTRDLELPTLLRAMALEDDFLQNVAKRALLSGLTDPASILYRQDILKDCLKNEAVVRDVYALAVETIENKRKNYWFYGSSRYPNPSLMLHSSVEVLGMLVGMLKRLRAMADARAGGFSSEGFSTLFAMLKRELDDEYFAKIEDHLRKLRFKNGVLISAKLGEGNKGRDYVLRKPNENKQSWLRRPLSKKSPYTRFASRTATRAEPGL